MAKSKIRSRTVSLGAIVAAAYERASRSTSHPFLVSALARLGRELCEPARDESADLQAA